jgi:hypothetical protein
MTSLFEDILIRLKIKDESGSWDKGFKGKLGALKATAGAVVTEIGAQTLAFSQSCVQAAIDAEKSWNAYTTALERAGMGSSEQIDKMKSEIKDLANTLGRSVGDVRTAATDYMNYGLSAEEAMKGAAATSAIAAAKNVDYASAESMVMSALKGRAAQLKALGINIDDYKDKTTGAIDTTRLFNDILTKYNNSQSKYSSSAAAQQQRFANAWASFKTAVGQALLPLLEALTPIITKIAQAMSNPVFASIVATILLIVSGLTLLAGPIMTISGLMDIFGISAAGLGGVLAALTGPVGIIVAAILVLVAIFAYAYETNEQFRQSVNQLGQNILKVGQDIYNFFKWVGDCINNFVKTCQDAWNSLPEPLRQAIIAGTSPLGLISEGVSAVSGSSDHGAGGPGAGETYQGNKKNTLQTVRTGNPHYSRVSNNHQHNTVNRNVTNHQHTYVLKEGAMRVDARNMTLTEAKQLVTAVFEDIPKKTQGK